MSKIFDWFTYLYTRIELDGFLPKESFTITAGGYSVTLASSPKELHEVLKLRYRVFYNKFKGEVFPWGLDLSKYDFGADHLIVKKDDLIVGTYRMISSKHKGLFFSLREFDHGSLKYIHEKKLELSRACIHPEYRNGVVLSLLWRGIFKYAKLVGAEYLFGCASFQAQNIHEAVFLWREAVNRGLHSNEYGIKPQPSYTCPKFAELRGWVGNLDCSFPTLVESYFKFGSKIYGDPAYDPHFKCYDYFTMLKISDMSEKHKMRYFAD